jgi:DNA-binding beta-propeller fold protein YncE
MAGRAGKALRALAVCIIMSGILLATGGSAPQVRAQRLAQGAQPRITLPTSLALDQSNGSVFVTTGDFSTQTAGATGPGRLLVLATGGGAARITQSVPVGDGPASVLVDPRADRVLVVNLGGGDQYAGYTGSSVSVLDRTTLERGGRRSLVHTTPLRGQFVQLVTSDSVTSRTFVAGWTLATSGQAGKGIVSTIDTKTGELVRSVTLNVVPLALAVDDRAGNVFVLYSGSPSASMIGVLDARTGTVVRTFLAGRTAFLMAVDGRNGRLFVATQRAVEVRSTRDGTLLRMVSLGQMPATIITDAQHGHVFVVTEGTLGANDQYVTNGTLWMLDAGTGVLLGRAMVGLYLGFLQMVTGVAQPIVSVNRAGTRIFVANNTSVVKGGTMQRVGSISVIQVSGTGIHLLRSTPVGTHGAIPVALSLDARTNRVYSSLTSVMAGVSTSDLAVLDGETGALIGAVPLPR